MPPKTLQPYFDFEHELWWCAKHVRAHYFFKIMRESFQNGRTNEIYRYSCCKNLVINFFHLQSCLVIFLSNGSYEMVIEWSCHVYAMSLLYHIRKMTKPHSCTVSY
jgi:hypothetical protein